MGVFGAKIEEAMALLRQIAADLRELVSLLRRERA